MDEIMILIDKYAYDTLKCWYHYRKNRGSPWPSCLPCARLARNKVDPASAVFWANLAHCRQHDHGGGPGGHTAKYGTRQKSTNAHDRLLPAVDRALFGSCQMSAVGPKLYRV
jgi:hypothetical protein